MEQEFDLHEMYRALAWGHIRSGDLDEALQYALRIINERKGAGDEEYMLALGIAGAIYEGKGDIDQALHFSELCLELAWGKFEKQPGDDNAMTVLCGCLVTSRLYQKLSRIEDAFRLYLVMYTVAESALVQSPGDGLFLKLKMLACESLADLYIRQDLPSNAYQFCHDYKTCCLALIETDPDDIIAKNKLNMSNILLGDYYLKTDDEHQALLYYKEAEQGAASVRSRHLDSDELAHSAEMRSTLALAYEKLSNVYEKLDDFEQAGHYSSKNAVILSELIRDHPETLIFQYNLASCHQHSGVISHAKQDFEAALEYFEKCYRLTVRLVHQVPDMTDLRRLTAIIYQYRAIIYTDMGELEQAVTNYLAMYNMLRDLAKLYPNDPLMRDNLAYACMRYALFCFKDNNDQQNALKYMEQGIGIYRQLVEEFPDIAEYQDKMEMAESGLDDLKNGRLT